MTEPSGRIAGIDLLRGAVIVLMALDHTRDYFSIAHFDPADLSLTTPALFFTRWVTHFCAPAFVFLAGTAAYLASARRGRAEMTRFLLTRGAWLVFLEWTVVQFAWTFNLRYEFGLIMQVIWAIGMSMIVLAGLIHLPGRAVLATGIVLIAGHNLLDPLVPGDFGALAPLWHILHVQGPVPFGFVAYPLIPWIGVMACGFMLGEAYRWEPLRRRRFLLRLGLGLTAGFVVLRALNVYGDPSPWSVQASPLCTVMSFLNTTKYPPSLLYLMMTLGPSLVALAWFEEARGRVAGFLVTLGSVPLFFYTAHLYLYHLAAGLTALALGFGTTVLTNFFLMFPDEWGFSLPAVYAAWIAGIALLYPLCRRFAAVKHTRRGWWLSYL